MRVLPPGYVGERATRLNELLDLLHAMPVVKDVVLDEKMNNGKGAARCNLWCRANHKPALQRPVVTLNSKPLDDQEAVPDFIVATERLIKKVSDGHAGCIDFAKDAAAAGGTASSAAAGSSSAQMQDPSIFEAMMQMEELKRDAKELNAMALVAQQAAEAKQQDIALMQRVLEPKRARQALGEAGRAAIRLLPGQGSTRAIQQGRRAAGHAAQGGRRGPLARRPVRAHAHLRPVRRLWPVAMIINSSELRAVGFKLTEELPLELEAAARAGMRMRGAGLRQLQGMGPTRWRLDVDDDNMFRSRCE